MQPLLYGALVPWYHLVDPVEEHADEAASYAAALDGAAVPRPETLLELGAGAGNNAYYLKQRFRCTLTDISPDMLARSLAQNPECEHVIGDMRSLRLERTFDAVLVHDAVTYMTSEADLRAAAQTAFAHTRSGGAAVFAPDYFRETFSEATEVIEGDDGARALRVLAWQGDPDPTDTTYVVEYAFLLRAGRTGGVQAVHDHHEEGLFPKGTWLQLLAEVGYEVTTFPRPIGDGLTDEVFICRKP